MQVKDIVAFGGPVVRIAEDEFAAGVTDELMERLFNEWNEAGSPVDHEKWIRARLSEIFICAGDRPKWPNDAQDWPEHEGMPMAFMGQLTVPAFQFPSGHRSSDCEIFVFGAPVGPPTSYRMTIKTIELFATLKNTRVTKIIKGVGDR
jgi:hypothetical protein